MGIIETYAMRHLEQSLLTKRNWESSVTYDGFPNHFAELLYLFTAFFSISILFPFWV